jgi:hypothetical protein
VPLREEPNISILLALLGGQPTIDRMASTDADYPYSLWPLAKEFELSTEEMLRIALAPERE